MEVRKEGREEGGGEGTGGEGKEGKGRKLGQTNTPEGHSKEVSAYCSLKELPVSQRRACLSAPGELVTGLRPTLAYTPAPVQRGQLELRSVMRPAAGA